MKNLLQLFILALLLVFGIQTGFAQKGKPGSPKTNLVNQIVKLSVEATPYPASQRTFDEQSNKMYGELDKILFDALSGRIDQFDELSAERKSELKAKLPEFTKKKCP